MKKLLIPLVVTIALLTGGLAQASFMGVGCQKLEGTLVKVSPEAAVSSRISLDVKFLIKKFGVRVNEGFTRPKIKCGGKTYPAQGNFAGHSSDSYHHKGLAIDIVAGKRGWNGVDRLIQYVRSVNKKTGKYKDILYNGVPNHGRGSHAHISYK